MNRKHRILVVDDNLALAENLAEIFASVGYEVDVADSAEAARAILRDRQCHAVLTDYRLPGRSGTELIEDLRDAGSRVPVVVMSGHTDAAIVERAEMAGAIDFLTKPVNIVKLLALVEALASEADALRLRA